MTEDRFITLTVAYERHAGRGPSLAWIAPELKDAGLRLIEDNHDGFHPSRTWAGLVNGSTFDHFADAWHLHDDNDQPTTRNADSHPTTDTHTLDGMNWETDGESPIIYTTVDVSALGNPHEAGTRAHHPPPFAHID
jgi:hypothetical protein